MKETSKYLIIGLVVVFVLGFIGVGYKMTVGKASMDADREIFESTKSYVHGMTTDLAKYKLELAQTTDPVERKAIITFIVENYANFDGDKIESDSLREFYYDVMEGRVQ